VKEWIKYGIIFFLGMTTVYFYLSLRQSGMALQLLQSQVLQQKDVLNGQCQQVLERQGFTVEKPPPPVVKEEPKEKDDAER
jgi:hypothetical protein